MILKTLNNICEKWPSILNYIFIENPLILGLIWMIVSLISIVIFFIIGKKYYFLEKVENQEIIHKNYRIVEIKLTSKMIDVRTSEKRENYFLFAMCQSLIIIPVFIGVFMISLPILIPLYSMMALIALICCAVQKIKEQYKMNSTKHTHVI